MANGSIGKHLPYEELIGSPDERMPAIRHREHEERRRLRLAQA